MEIPSEYRGGQIVTLPEISMKNGLQFLGWYDNPEFNGSPITTITSTDSGDKVFYAKWEPEIFAETVEINKIDELLLFTTHQLVWTITPANATFPKVTFASTDTNVLTVSEKGLIEAISVGTAKVLITVHGNTALNMELEIEVYVDPYMDGEFEDTSYVVVEDTIQLSAKVVGTTSSGLVWTSKTPDIATVDDSGVVEGVKEGVAEIVVSSKDDDQLSFTFYVTVLAEEATGVLKFLLDSHNSEIYYRENLLIGLALGSDGAYIQDIVGSVSKLLFEDYVVYDDYYLSNPSNKSTLNGDGIGGIDFITVH